MHGEDAARTSEKISQALFYGNLQELAETEIEEGFNDVPSFVMEESETNLVDLLVNAKVSSSKRQAREALNNGAIYINGERCTDLEHTMRKSDGLHGKFIVIRRGKNKYTLVR